jgi:hypothetical protein
MIPRCCSARQGRRQRETAFSFAGEPVAKGGVHTRAIRQTEVLRDDAFDKGAASL